MKFYFTTVIFSVCEKFKEFIIILYNPGEKYTVEIICVNGIETFSTL